MKPRITEEKVIDKYVDILKDVTLAVAWENIKKELHGLRDFFEDNNIDTDFEEEEQ